MRSTSGSSRENSGVLEMLLWLGSLVLLLLAAAVPAGGEEALDQAMPAAAAAACAACAGSLSGPFQRLASARRLTRREIQISRHVASGWTNGDIAEHLGIGVRTIETHLLHVYRKLGVHNRRRLTSLLRSPTA